MIKRMNKLTALMVAATAVASIVPAASASAATKLQSQDGNIDTAVAFGDGKYIYEGYMTDDDTSGLYFNNGEKDSYLEDDEDYDFSSVKYGTKYVVVKEDGEDYLLDLSTGKILSDDTIDELRENVETKLRSTLKKADERYALTNRKIVFEDGDSINKVLENQFGDVWYSYALKDADNADKTLYGFVNESGKYIDVSATANMTVSTTDSAVKVTEYDKEKNNVEVSLAGAPQVIAQDSNYLYTITKVSVKVNNSDDGTRTYIQKISKAQGSTKDGAYIPKSVDSYEISDSLYIDEKNEDTTEAQELLNKIANNDGSVIGTRVVKDTIYVTTLEDGKVNVNTIKLKKEKVTKNKGTKKLDVYVAVKDQDDNEKVEGGKDAISIDVNGNTWAVNRGKIYKFNGKEFVEAYTCDRTIDHLDVYDENNLIAWSDEVYATVQTKSKDDTTEDDKNEVAKAGWVKNSDGTWSYNKADGTKATGWLLDGSTWYYLNANGIMQTGWLNLNGTWYYLQSSGAMKTGWLLDGSTWYYLQSSGAMKTGWLNDNGTWYYLNSNGSMKTGWLKDTDGRWYFLQSNGAMATNTTVDGYRLGSNGAWIR
ncbi:N-acetylmuramoyl-L-alanine amidase family protein [uncultured Clostridium sp.]|uniref:N-acetylmuramoyl-L-alanine amidase family protein n=1 Tax=uncultured Clostridium sp. TaxID=59620 RepID=UPI0025F240AF|nr:N-acetylmuramoyl-L-alanine amidase family protein [uncultured Clostridium sp.]